MEVNISHILYDLLREHNRVSVPCLGSFVAHYHSADIEGSRKSILPPFKEIIFNPQEIWNDERLERMLADRIGCTIAEAREKVAFWVDELCFKLATERMVALDKLGVLNISGDNQVTFTLNSNVNMLDEAYGLPPLKLDKALPDKVEIPESIPTYEPKKRSYAWLIFLGVVFAVAGLLVLYYNS